MNKDQVKGSASEKKGQAEGGAEKDKETEDETTENNKGKSKKHNGKDDTVLGEINRDSRKETK